MSASSGRAVPDLRDRVLGGLGWVVGSQIGLQLTRVVTAIAVARLLTPDEYGLAMLALVFASLVLVSEVDRDAAFWVTAASGILFALLGVALPARSHSWSARSAHRLSR
jgi:hypothetical protein